MSEWVAAETRQVCETFDPQSLGNDDQSIELHLRPEEKTSGSEPLPFALRCLSLSPPLRCLANSRVLV